ncbi:LADA_0F09978g1_1 [Lachancea dasiensis]|uniref:LADA_0F09978g1_1 n=1 Tax=Lachancea dasiensis TaxID=1072105 RepID=A0A1G4JLH1_9SACH|nr:LADA_0F09978g1_1 [Lachancea dasiensis]
MSDRPLSYDELVDHIVNGKAVPNILHIPNVTLDASLSKDASMKPRAKPWEEGKKLDLEVDNGPSEDIPSVPEVVEEEQVSRAASSEHISQLYSLDTEFELQLEQFLGGIDESIGPGKSV